TDAPSGTSLLLATPITVSAGISTVYVGGVVVDAQSNKGCAAPQTFGNFTGFAGALAQYTTTASITVTATTSTSATLNGSSFSTSWQGGLFTCGTSSSIISAATSTVLTFATAIALPTTTAVIFFGALSVDPQGNTGCNGAVLITNNTASSSATTGAMVVTGGVGMGGKLNVGGTATVTSTLTVNNTGNATPGVTIFQQAAVGQVGLTITSTSFPTVHRTAIHMGNPSANLWEIGTNSGATFTKDMYFYNSAAAKVGLSMLDTGSSTVKTSTMNNTLDDGAGNMSVAGNVVL